jgi:hypothetical protein
MLQVKKVYAIFFTLGSLLSFPRNRNAVHNKQLITGSLKPGVTHHCKRKAVQTLVK